MYLFSKDRLGRERGEEAGFTFVECLLALIILAVALAPLLLCFPLGAKEGRLARKMTIATDLAEDLMDEIKKMAFEEPGVPGSFGREGGESTPRNGTVDANDFDDVDDYDEWKIESPPEDMDGNLGDGAGGRPDYRGFTRKVEVINVTEGDLNTEAPGGDGSTDFKRVKVTVFEEDIPDIEVVTVVTKY